MSWLMTRAPNSDCKCSLWQSLWWSHSQTGSLRSFWQSLQPIEEKKLTQSRSTRKLSVWWLSKCLMLEYCLSYLHGQVLHNSMNSLENLTLKGARSQNFLTVYTRRVAWLKKSLSFCSLCSSETHWSRSRSHGTSERSLSDFAALWRTRMMKPI